MADKITKDMKIDEVVERFPQTVKVFMDFGIPCLVCGEPPWDTIEEAAIKYEVDLDKLLEELNKRLSGTL